MKPNGIPVLFLAVFILLGGIVQYLTLSRFQSLPSPITSGDLNFQMGAVNHIRYGGNPLESSSMIGGVPGYLPLYGFLCAHFTKVAALETPRGMLLFSLVLFVAGSLLWFLLFKTLLGDNWIALIGTLLGSSIEYYPILKYTPFTRHIIMPLFLIALILLFRKKTLLRFILLGFVYGISTLSHMVFFAGATLLILTFLASDLLQVLKRGEGRVLQYVRENLKNWIAFAGVSLPLVMLYWHKPLFVYHLRQQNNFMQWNVVRDWFSFSEQKKFLFESLAYYLFNFQSLKGAVLTLLFWSGIPGYFQLEKQEARKFLIVFAFGSFFATFCYFLTVPLAKIHFVPNHMASFYITAIQFLMAGFGLFGITRILRLDRQFKSLWRVFFFGILFCLFFGESLCRFKDHLKGSRWTEIGGKPLADRHLSLQKYLLENTDVDHVFLSTKKIGFAVNAMSGRKLVVNRWTHQNDPFMDFSQRDVDAAIILYGNDMGKKKDLIRKYQVRYLYWEDYWINSEFQFDAKGNMVRIENPLYAFESERYKRELEDNGIRYRKIKWRVEASLQGAPKLDLIAVTPINYHTPKHPWKPDLDDYLEEVWCYAKGEKKEAILYRFKGIPIAGAAWNLKERKESNEVEIENAGIFCFSTPLSCSAFFDPVFLHCRGRIPLRGSQKSSLN